MVYDDTPIVVVYSDPDRELAETIIGDLEMVGFTAFLHGDTKHDPNSSQRMVVVVSESALTDRKLQKTWEAALENGKRLCSVRVASAPLPDVLNRAQWVDFALGYQVGFNGLKAALLAAPMELERDIVATQIVTDLDDISSSWIFYSIAVGAAVLIVGVIVIILILIL